MSKERVTVDHNYYPGFTEVEPNLAFSGVYQWGSVKITSNAVEAYGLEVEGGPQHDTEEASHLLPHQIFRADIMIAGPTEIKHNGPDGRLMAALAVHRRGTRITLGADQDKDLTSLGIASQLIQELSLQLPENERPHFLMTHGEEIQDGVQDQTSSIIAHVMAETSRGIVRDSYMLWAEKFDSRAALRSINAAGILALVGAGAFSGADVLSDGKIEASTGLITLGYLGWLAVKARAEVRKATVDAPSRIATNQMSADAYGVLVNNEIHQLLCKNAK